MFIFFTNSVNDDVKNIYWGFSFKLGKSFDQFHDTISEPGAQYLFVIMNTDRSDKKGTHRWSFHDLHPKKEIFLFDSFSFEGFKEFIIQDDKRSSIRYFMTLESLIKRTIKLL